MNDKKYALIIIDMQNDFVLPGAPACVSGAFATIPIIKRLLDLFRGKNIDGGMTPGLRNMGQLPRNLWGQVLIYKKLLFQDLPPDPVARRRAQSGLPP
ncbi:MAG: hypothetical protein ABSA06_10310 [Geobacteraceae bacterium]|jgi:isochorismate hydrolase